MHDWQIASALLAAHNIARALGGLADALRWIAFAIVLYPWIGGFASSGKLKVKIDRTDGAV